MIHVLCESTSSIAACFSPRTEQCSRSNSTLFYSKTELRRTSYQYLGSPRALERDWSPRLHLKGALPLPSFPLQQTSSTLQQQQQHKVPNNFFERDCISVKVPRLQNKFPATLRIPAAKGQVSILVGCHATSLRQKPHSRLSESACWSTTCFFNSNFSLRTQSCRISR